MNFDFKVETNGIVPLLMEKEGAGAEERTLLEYLREAVRLINEEKQDPRTVLAGFLPLDLNEAEVQAAMEHLNKVLEEMR